MLRRQRASDRWRPPRAQDVIFDGTMMWAPFVEQTIAMVRDHRHRYRRGPGYHKSDGCNVERCST